MQTKHITDQQEEALWRKAQISGLSRRKFLVLLGAGGATAVLAACTPGVVTQTVTVTPTPTPTIPPPTTSPSPTTPPRLIQKPIPEQFFIPLGTNAEMRFEDMAIPQFNTPESMFFVRSHSSTPIIDSKTWKLRVEGDGVESPFEITYDELLKMPSKTYTRYVECAGNGRSFFTDLLNKPAEGGQWRLGAYGVADWTGVQLSELLKRAKLKSTAVDIMPTGLDSTSVERPMPVDKAMEEDTMLAYLMNGNILPLDHGFPVRVLAPGWVGINSIKWVGKITVSQKPIYVDKNTNTYVLIGPDYQPTPQAKGPPVTTQVIKSACALPWQATLRAGQQKVTGYAWSPFGRISKVEVSVDGGKTFQNATLIEPNIARAGCRWEFNFSAAAGDMTITPKATDDKGNAQYDVSQQKWNQLGYIFGAMVPHPVKVV